MPRTDDYESCDVRRVGSARAKRARRKCGKALAELDAEETGLVLADLMAAFLAGLVVAGDPEETERLRVLALKIHGMGIAELVPVYAREIGTEQMAEPGARH